MNNKFWLVFIMAGVSSGCTNGFYYSKPGTTEQERNKDAYECQREATYYSSDSYLSGNNNQIYGTSSSGPSVNENMMRQCLRARGYTISNQKQSQNYETISNSSQCSELGKQTYEMANGELVCY